MALFFSGKTGKEGDNSMGRNLWNVSEVYISAATKCISKSDIKYLKVACRIEGKMVFMQIFDDAREKNPYKAM